MIYVRWNCYDLWDVTFNAAKTQVPSLYPPLGFCNQELPETVSHKHLRLIFHRSLTWHLHLSPLYHRAMSKMNALKKIEHFLPRHSLLVLYRAYVFPSVIMVIADANLLESV